MWVFCCLLVRHVALLGLCAGLALCSDTVIRNVTIVDVTTGAELPRHSVLIHDDQIASVGVHVPEPKGAHEINGAGKWLIPGLWDMHVHLWDRQNHFAQFMAYGVTGLRDMGSDMVWLNRWRDEIKAGKLIGPHVQTCGSPVDGKSATDPKLPVFIVATPAQARATFDRLDFMDVDFIQVLPDVPRDAYFALVERARKYYVPVAGPVPHAVRLTEAINARQKSFEQMTGLLLGASKDESKLRKRLIESLDRRDEGATVAIEAEILQTFDPKKAARLFEDMALYETREVPTLVALQRQLKKGISEDGVDVALSEYDKLRSLIPIMRKAGVRFMTGTDAGEIHSTVGLDLHREMELLVEAGLTPLEALRSATIEPARFLGAESTLGSIEAGRYADLVLLDANPLKDIRNTQKIDAVFVQGHYLSRAHITALKRQAAAPHAAGAGESPSPGAHPRSPATRRGTSAASRP